MLQILCLILWKLKFNSFIITRKYLTLIFNFLFLQEENKNGVFDQIEYVI
jgi:hypothetical protein